MYYARLNVQRNVYISIYVNRYLSTVGAHSRVSWAPTPAASWRHPIIQFQSSHLQTSHHWKVSLMPGIC